MKLRNDTKYVHVWYEGYDGLSAIINRRKVPDDPDVIFSNFLVSPSVTTKNVTTSHELLPGTWYDLEVMYGKALPSITKKACEAVCKMGRDAEASRIREHDIVIYKLPNDDVRSRKRIYGILHNEENDLKCEVAMCTTVRYLFEEGEDGHILNGHRVQCVHRGFFNNIENPGGRYEIGTNPLDRDQF